MTALTGPMDPERILLNLLAQIHRDGGHHTGVHGVADSARDAGLEVARLQAQLEDAGAETAAAQAEVARLQKKRSGLIGELLDEREELEAENARLQKQATASRLSALQEVQEWETSCAAAVQAWEETETELAEAEAREKLWRSRCPVTEAEVIAAGLTPEQAAAWFDTRDDRVARRLRRFIKSGVWPHDLPASDYITDTINELHESDAQVVARTGRPQRWSAHDILEAMAATKGET